MPPTLLKYLLPLKMQKVIMIRKRDRGIPEKSITTEIRRFLGRNNARIRSKLGGKSTKLGGNVEGILEEFCV